MRRIFIVILIAILILIPGCTQENSNYEVGDMKLTSPVFEHNQMIPTKYTCQREDISPPLEISEIPEEAKSLALLVDDPDAPMGTWVHWVVCGITPDKTRIEEGEVPGKQGENNFGKLDYGGPCPPSGTHRYYFKLYALDFEPNLSEGYGKKDLLREIDGHVIEKTELIGLYERI